MEKNMTKFIINPDTGSLIEVNKPTYNRLLSTRKINSRTTKFEIPIGPIKWHDQVPMRTIDRRKMHKTYGRCYLVKPSASNNYRPKYPICIPGSCTFHCDGIKAALKGAIRTKNKQVYDKARKLLIQYCSSK
jgi:hypothetical protein